MEYSKWLARAIFQVRMLHDSERFPRDDNGYPIGNADKMIRFGQCLGALWTYCEILAELHGGSSVDWYDRAMAEADKPIGQRSVSV